MAQIVLSGLSVLFIRVLIKEIVIGVLEIRPVLDK